MTPRTHMQPLEREAMSRLDAVRDGADAPPILVETCLRITGDLINFREYTDDGEPVMCLERRPHHPAHTRAHLGAA